MKWIDKRAALAVACTVLLAAPPAQMRALAQTQQQDAPLYKLVILRGENAQNNIKKGRATRPVVEVRDRNNKPVAGVAVVFALPTSGPSGTFVGGGQMTTVTTNNLGQASASFTPNQVPGQYNINVSTSSGGQSVAVQIATANVLATAAVTATTLAVILGVVAAAGVGTAVALTGGDNNNGGNNQPGGIRIGVGAGGTVTPPRP
ncbi:hypothetical protein F183_A51420 [Bryobacterales bacterium F-183]|nr:hypothetical protein F183_A51420 [Bryobacterales bacterium F-183]